MKKVFKIIPFPGTKKAREQGCICISTPSGKVIPTPNCPLHTTKKPPKTLAIN